MKKLSVLIIGSGGREHALGWKIKQSPLLSKLYFAPGNAGTAQVGENVSIAAKEIHKLADWVEKNKIDFTIVGPDDPLAMGIVDLFQSKGLHVFGPTKAAARLEWSKAFAGDFIDKYHIPQPVSRSFTDPEKAKEFVRISNLSGFVVKASGLALGKGVLIPNSKAETLDAIDRIMVQKEFGDAGTEIVIQEKLVGQELSFFALCDGKTALPMIALQDHKRIFDNDEGPNTGGMGTYTPVPFMNTKLEKEIMAKIVQPTIDGMAKEGSPYVGVLFVGLMMTNDGPKVLEFNARFGDPETQSMMRVLESDLLELFLSCTDGSLATKKINFSTDAAACVVIAAENYPNTPKKGDEVFGLEKDYQDVVVFHAGTTLRAGKVHTSGGRVLNITARAQTLRKSLQKCYSAIGSKGIHFRGMQYRKDIGKKALV